MLQITLLFIMTLILVGTILFSVLMYASGFLESAHLHKKNTAANQAKLQGRIKKKKRRKKDKINEVFFIVYLISLIIFILIVLLSVESQVIGSV